MFKFLLFLIKSHYKIKTKTIVGEIFPFLRKLQEKYKKNISPRDLQPETTPGVIVIK